MVSSSDNDQFLQPCQQREYGVFWYILESKTIAPLFEVVVGPSSLLIVTTVTIVGFGEFEIFDVFKGRDARRAPTRRLN